jgi:hypothetical protein
MKPSTLALAGVRARAFFEFVLFYLWVGWGGGGGWGEALFGGTRWGFNTRLNALGLSINLVGMALTSLDSFNVIFRGISTVMPKNVLRINL